MITETTFHKCILNGIQWKLNERYFFQELRLLHIYIYIYIGKFGLNENFPNEIMYFLPFVIFLAITRTAISSVEIWKNSQIRTLAWSFTLWKCVMYSLTAYVWHWVPNWTSGGSISIIAWKLRIDESRLMTTLLTFSVLLFKFFNFSVKLLTDLETFLSI